MKTNKRLLPIFLFIVGLLAAGYSAERQAVAQTSGQTVTLIEDFANGSFPPALNLWNFNHNFTLNTAWDLGGSTINEPLSQTPPFGLTLYAGNEDRITFNLPSPTAYADSAQVRGWAPPARNDLEAGRGRVVFEGTGDSKTFTFIGGAQQWQLFKATANDVGDAGLPLGEIMAVRLADMGGNNGVRVMFDDLEVLSVTPPRRANLTLTMSGSANNVNVGDTLNYDLTISNSGPESAPNVTLTDTLPIGAAFLAGSSDAACSLVLGQVVCNLGALAVNGSRMVRIAVQVGSDACATFVNRATVTAQALDGNMADNTAVHTATTPLPACADYSVILTGSQVPVNPEEFFTYDLTIRNNGPDTTGGTLNVTWPTEISVFSLTPDSGISCSSTNPLTCTINPLVPGQQKQIIVTGKTVIAATGLLEATAQVTPNIPDPQPENNSSRYRFVIGTPYTYTLIAEAGVGPLAGFTDVGDPVINNNGEVAFWATQDGLTDFAIFSGDENAVTRRLGLSDLPSVTDPQSHTYNVCLSMNDAGWITASTHTYEVIDNLSTKVGNIVHLLPPSGNPVVLYAASRDVDGWDFRQYNYVALNNSNHVLAVHNSPFSGIASGITEFQGGQQTEIYTTTNQINHIGLNDNGDYAFSEVAGSWLPQYSLNLVWRGSKTLTNLLQYSTIIYGGGVLNMNGGGAVPYSQKHQDPTTGTVYDSLYIRGPQPVIQRIALDGNPNGGGFMFVDAGINDYGRWVVRGQGWGPNRKQYGLFIGPHYVAHRVVNFSGVVGADPGTPMFGSRARASRSSCNAVMNNAGQVVFATSLEDGRVVVVRADPTLDNDGDGVLDYDELGARNNGDGNGDGVPDSVQPHVTAVRSLADPFQTITFTTDQNYTLTNVQAIPNPSPGDAPNDPFWFGHFAFEIRDVPVGGAATVEVTLPWAGIRSWWKYGPTPGNATPHWYDFIFDGTTGAEINGNVVTLHFVDGGVGDSDRTANGVIVDPGGPTGFPYATFLPTVLR